MNLVTDLPTRAQIRARLTSPASPSILPVASSAAWSHIFGRTDLAHVLDGLVGRARGEVDEPMPALSPALYREFHLHGTRDKFQHAYFERRRRLGRAQIALLAGEPAGREAFIRSYLEKLEDVSREVSWALPAHVADPSGCDARCIDIASAETAHLMAESLAIFGAFVPESSRLRILARLRAEFFENYLDDPDRFFWVSTNHNWNAVCHHGVLGAALAIEEDLDLVAGLLAEAAPRLAVFLDGFTSDGGCSEGLDCWSSGFGNLAALNEMLEVRTGGAISLFTGNERIRAIARYAPALSLAGGRVVNFADAKNIPVQDWVLAYLGTRLRDDSCRRQAMENFRFLYRNPDRAVDYDAFNANFSHWQRVFRHASTTPVRASAAPFTPDVLLPELGVWVARGTDRDRVLWELAAKAGHNDEHHNHNDVGSFILNLDGVPMLTEIGAPEYVKDFFRPETRYGFLAARSQGHSLPVVNGFEQRAGTEFRGEVRRADCGRDEVVFEAELTRAYPAEAGLARLVRRLEFGKKAGALTWVDEFELVGGDQVESALMTDAPEVRILSPYLAQITKSGRRLNLCAGDGVVWDRVERFDYRDHAYRSAHVSRLVLRPARAARAFALRVTISVERAV